MKKISFLDSSSKAEYGDEVELTLGNHFVVKCEQTGVLMLNVDANELAVGDLRFIKKLGLTISNPETDRPIALGEDYKEDSWGEQVHRYISTPSTKDDDDDSSFFSSSGSLFGGSGFGGFGGFSGGGFSGGGASASW